MFNIAQTRGAAPSNLEPVAAFDVDADGRIDSAGQRTMSLAYDAPLSKRKAASACGEAMASGFRPAAPAPGKDVGHLPGISQMIPDFGLIMTNPTMQNSLATARKWHAIHQTSDLKSDQAFWTADPQAADMAHVHTSTSTERSYRPDSRELARLLAHYRTPNVARSVLELVNTAVPFVLVWALMWAALDAGYWAGLLIAVPAAAFLVRLFMIQHDCGHGSFFHNRRANDWVGRVIGVLTLTPYDLWRRTHARHHAGSGNLDRRGIGEIDTLTVREYLALPRWRQLLYHLYRHPMVMFGIGPAYLFLLRNRLPFGMMRSGWRPWLSTMVTNGAIAILAGAMIWLVGLGPFLLVHLPITLLAASIGVWLFYIQHQFEDTYWAHDEGWSFHAAALHGSSHYDLPGVLRWFTANIGVHHVHHLCSRIPYYRLPHVLRDYPQFAAVGRLTLFQSFPCVRKVLWDERRQKLVTFREMQTSLPLAGTVRGRSRSYRNTHCWLEPETTG